MGIRKYLPDGSIDPNYVPGGMIKLDDGTYIAPNPMLKPETLPSIARGLGAYKPISMIDALLEQSGFDEAAAMDRVNEAATADLEQSRRDWDASPEGIMRAQNLENLRFGSGGSQKMDNNNWLYDRFKAGKMSVSDVESDPELRRMMWADMDAKAAAERAKEPVAFPHLQELGDSISLAEAFGVRGEDGSMTGYNSPNAQRDVSSATRALWDNPAWQASRQRHSLQLPSETERQQNVVARAQGDAAARDYRMGNPMTMPSGGDPIESYSLMAAMSGDPRMIDNVLRNRGMMNIARMNLEGNKYSADQNVLAAKLGFDSANQLERYRQEGDTSRANLTNETTMKAAKLAGMYGMAKELGAAGQGQAAIDLISGKTPNVNAATLNQVAKTARDLPTPEAKIRYLASVYSSPSQGAELKDAITLAGLDASTIASIQSKYDYRGLGEEGGLNPVHWTLLPHFPSTMRDYRATRNAAMSLQQALSGQ